MRNMYYLINIVKVIKKSTYSSDFYLTGFGQKPQRLIVYLTLVNKMYQLGTYENDVA